jgi:TonB family protein
MATVALGQSNYDMFDRLFAVMIGASIAAHLILLITALVVPPLFNSDPEPEKVIQIEMLIKDLPKGPNIGTQASWKNVSAARAPDHRKAAERAKKEKHETMSMKKKAPKIKSKRLNYKERARQTALERVKQLKEAKAGGGGSANKSGGNVFAIYLARVKRRLQAAWSLPPGLSPAEKSKKVVCRIKINSNGVISAQWVARSSGLPHLDRSATAAISAVGSVPPPPPLVAAELAGKGMSVTFDPMTK